MWLGIKRSETKQQTCRLIEQGMLLRTNYNLKLAVFVPIRNSSRGSSTRGPVLAGLLCMAAVLCCPAASQIDWLIAQQDPNTWLLDSYEGDGTNTAWIYDQALAVVAFTDAGLISKATNILETMRGLQLTGPDGVWHECYNSSNTSIVVESRLNSGPIAWMAMAINFYEARTGDTNYAAVGKRALDYLTTMIINAPGSETNGAVRYSNYDPQIISTEHNLDAYSAYLYRGLLNSNNVYLTTASNILQYLANEMWALSTNSNGPYNLPIFWEGWNNYVFSTDPQSWGVLALGPIGPNGEEFYRCTEWLWWNEWGNTRNAQNFSPTVTGVDGFRPSTGDRPHIWVEGTEGVARAFYRIGDYAAGICNSDQAATNSAHGDYFHSEMGRTASTNGGLVHSFWDIAPGNNTWPENWRYNHVASVAWHYFNERRVNPFAPPVPHREPVFIRLAGTTNGLVQIGWDSVAGLPYRVQCCSELNTRLWYDLGASMVGTGGRQWLSDCLPLRTHRFYRVLLGK